MKLIEQLLQDLPGTQHPHVHSENLIIVHHIDSVYPLVTSTVLRIIFERITHLFDTHISIPL